MKKTILFISLFLSMVLCASMVFAQGRMIAVDSSRALFEIDILTGAKTPIGTVSANASTTAGLAYNRATGTLWLSSTGNDNLYTLDLATGDATLVGFYGDAGIVMHGLEYDDSTNTLYGASGGGTTAGFFYTVDQNNGFATFVANTGLASFTNLVYDSLNDVMYATNSNTDSFYSVNRATGAVTLIGPLNGPTNPNGLAYNSDNDTIYMVDNNTDSFYSINRATGAATLIGSMGAGNLLGLAYIPIPEPSALIAIGIGLSSLLAARRVR